MKGIVAMQKPIERERSAYQPVSKPLLARHARQWAVGTGLATGAAVAAAVVALTTTPTAHADDGTGVPINIGDAQSVGDKMVGLVNEISGLSPITTPSGIGPLQIELAGDISTALAAATSPDKTTTVAEVADVLQREAQLNAVNSAVDWGNSTYNSDTEPSADAAQIDSNESYVVGVQVPFESDIANFYQNLHSDLVHSQDETNRTLVKLTTDALDYQTLASEEVSNKNDGLGSLNEIGIDNPAGITKDNVLLGDYDTDLYNYTGWLTEYVGLDNAL